MGKGYSDWNLPIAFLPVHQHLQNAAAWEAGAGTKAFGEIYKPGAIRTRRDRPPLLDPYACAEGLERLHHA
jgi:hypothetical protein